MNAVAPSLSVRSAVGEDRAPPTPVVRGAVVGIFVSYLQDIVFLRIIFVFGRLDPPFC